MRVIDCRFTANESVRGGAVAVKNSGVASLINCLLDGNQASLHGGGLSIDKAGDVTLINVTIANNDATLGGGIAQFSDTNNALVMRNSIIWGNTANNGPGIYTDFAPGSTAVYYSDVQSGWTGTGSNNINSDPLFENAGAGNFRLSLRLPRRRCLGPQQPDDVLPRRRLRSG